tara:strand:+ start:9211 stop:9615 length:405 start_codon:yes stop_codon:yes gene_type:complete
MDKAHTNPSELDDVDLSVRVIRKQEFAKRLYKIIVAKNLTQSEVARMSGLGRDSISQYVRGLNIPKPTSLAKLAEALKVEPEELYPNYQAASVEEELPEQSFRAVSGDPEFMWVRINIKLPKSKALEVMRLINE